MNKNNIFFILSILICLIFMFYWIDKKEGFHEDEIFSYGSSNYKYDNLFQAASDRDAMGRVLEKYVYKDNIFETIKNAKYYLLDNREKFDEEVYSIMKTDTPIWKTPSDAKDYLTVSENEIFSYGSVYINQARDVHPPFFYFIVHLVSSIFLNSFSKYIIFFINICAFIGVCIVLRKILKLFNKDYLSIPLVLLYGLSIGAISTVIFLRMYSMVTFFCILYLYYNLKIFKNNFESDKKTFVLLSTTTVLGFLTQYYFCIYALFIFIIMLIKIILSKKYKVAFKYTLNHIISAVIGVLLFIPSIFHIFFSYRGVGSVSENSNLLLQSKTFFELLFNGFALPYKLGICILIIGIAFLIIKLILQIRKNSFDINNLFYCLILIIPAILFTIIVSKISPFEHMRYIMPVIPVFALLFILLLDNIKLKEQIKLIIIYTTIIGISIFGIFTNKPICLYSGYNECLEIAEKYKNLDYIYVCDNSFTHINSLPEFMIYNKSMILNSNHDNFEFLKTDEELQAQESFILTIKTWLNVDETLNKVLQNSNFTKFEKLLDGGNQAESAVFLISR